MKKLLLIGMAFILTTTLTNAQERGITRGVSGELYLSDYWYGIYNPDWGYPVFDTLLKAVYHVTDYGKKVEIVYAVDYFILQEDYPYFDSTVVVPVIVIADATPGVLYSRCSRYSSNLNSWLHSFWVSFDNGQTWMFREEDQYRRYYYASIFEGLIYRMLNAGYDHSVSESTDYGETWQKIGEQVFIYDSECGFNSGELFGITGSSPEPWKLFHTYDWYETYTITPIDKQYVFGSMWGIFPDVYRGALPGEVYVSSWFPDWTYKISFSADTGQTFRVVYHSDSLYFLGKDRTFYLFMSDKEAGVFYIIYNELVEINEPEGHYAKMCISHYTDYGETLVGTYCHDLMMHYPESCAGVLDMEAKVQGNNNVALQWNPPHAYQPVTAYYVYRDDTLIAELQQTTYLDEDLPNGTYTYHVRVVYGDGCESLSYNTVKVAVDFTGIASTTLSNQITVYPNPTNGMINVQCLMINAQNIEIFDVFGRKLVSNLKSQISNQVIDISHFPSGIYFVRITTENSVVVRKVVKQ